MSVIVRQTTMTRPWGRASSSSDTFVESMATKCRSTFTNKCWPPKLHKCQRIGLRQMIPTHIDACLFEEHPGKLDWQVYNDRDKYGDDPHHDGGELLPITEQNAKAINGIIWDVVTSHRYTRLSKPRVVAQPF